MTDFPIPAASLPPLPAVAEPDRYGIAIVGAGDIVTSAHLPAYQKMGYRVSGLFDIDRDRAERTAAEYAIPQVYPDLDALLSDDTVDIVDIAVPPWAQETMVEQIARAGRHLLCQKPLAVQAARGAELVAAAEQAGVRLAVNVNMRWSPAIRTLKQLIQRDLFGETTGVHFQLNFWDEWKT
ncbi:MAG: Gfo/Idh/MocA family protein, partial [Bythopirellula sp.]